MTQQPAQPRTSLVEQLIDIVNHEEDVHPGAHDAYWTRIEELMAVALKGDAPQDYFEMQLLRKLRGGQVLELSARHVGFVLGFEYCLSQILGPKGGVQ